MDHRFTYSFHAIGSRTVFEHEKGGKAASSSPISVERPKCRRRLQAFVVRARCHGLAVALGYFCLDLDPSDVGRNCKEPLAQCQHHCHDCNRLWLPCCVSLLGIHSQASPTTVPLTASPDKPQRARRLRHWFLLFRRLLYLDPAVLLYISAGRRRRFHNGSWLVIFSELFSPCSCNTLSRKTCRRSETLPGPVSRIRSDLNRDTLTPNSLRPHRPNVHFHIHSYGSLHICRYQIYAPLQVLYHCWRLYLPYGCWTNDTLPIARQLHRSNRGHADCYGHWRRNA